MMSNIVNCFLENQKQVTAPLGTEFYSVQFGWRFKMQHDFLAFEHIRSKLSDAHDHVGEIVAPRIDRPHDVSHGIDQRPSGLSYFVKQEARLLAGVSQLLLHYFA